MRHLVVDFRGFESHLYSGSIGIQSQVLEEVILKWRLSQKRKKAYVIVSNLKLRENDQSSL